MLTWSWQLIGGAEEAVVPGGSSKERPCHLDLGGCTCRGAWLRTSLRYHLLPLCSLPLPICARPLLSQRIKKKKLAWFKETESGICGLPLPQLSSVSVTSDHCGLACFSHPFSRLWPDVTNGAVHFAVPCCRDRMLLVFCNLPAKCFLFHLILASAACRLQKAFSESRFHKLQNPSTSNHYLFSLGTIL